MGRVPRRVGPSSRASGRFDRWFAALAAAAIASIFGAQLWETPAVALAVGLPLAAPALAFASSHRIVGRRLIFWSFFRPRAWRLDDITNVEVQPYLAIQGTTYGVRVEREDRAFRRRRVIIASTYSGSRVLVEQTMLDLDRRLRQLNAERYA